MILTRRDRPVKGAGEERGAARAGGPCKTHDEIRRPSQDDPCGAGRFWPIAALLVGHDASASLPPRASHWAKIGSVTAGQNHVIRLLISSDAHFLLAALSCATAISANFDQPRAVRLCYRRLGADTP